MDMTYGGLILAIAIHLKILKVGIKVERALYG